MKTQGTDQFAIPMYRTRKSMKIQGTDHASWRPIDLRKCHEVPPGTKPKLLGVATWQVSKW